ncbi:hypothetical protein NDU88_008064, partial [Pleurodeles waltl]
RKPRARRGRKCLFQQLCSAAALSWEQPVLGVTAARRNEPESIPEPRSGGRGGEAPLLTLRLEVELRGSSASLYRPFGQAPGEERAPLCSTLPEAGTEGQLCLAIPPSLDKDPGRKEPL